jgi:arylsulfatase A-like enzyme
MTHQTIDADSLQRQLSDLEVSNVYLYVGDAVRWDALPERLRQRGPTMKTVAASIHTPTSFPSITTGLHPPQHGIWDFSFRLNADLPTLLHLDGFQTAFANSLDEKFVGEPDQEFVLGEVLKTNIASMHDLESINPPFVFMERGRGGHSPYGEYDGNGWEYYREHGAASTDHYKADYAEGVEMDIDHFETQLETLEERGLLDDTLIVYTSDHGELLGEGGCLGHNEPIHPGHVYVPTVLIHPTLTPGNVEGVFRHVDLLPTITSVLDVSLEGLPGRDLTRELPAEQGPTYYRRAVAEQIPGISGVLDYESVWDRDGGHVFPLNGRVNRGVIFLGNLVMSAKREYMRAHAGAAASHYLAGERTYGTPRLDVEAARRYLAEIGSLEVTNAGKAKLGDSAKEQLRELGYLG